MRRVALIIVAVALAVSGCKKDPVAAEASIDITRASSELETRMAKLFDRPIVAKAVDQFFDFLGSSPALRDRGTALLDALQADPKVAQPIQTLMGELTSDPGLMRAVTELMAEHPGASADQIGTMVGDRFAQAWASPQISAAWQNAWNGLMRAISGDPDLASIEHSVFARFTVKYNDAALMSKWNKRIAELGNGSALSRDDATKLFLERFFAPDRIENIVADVLANPTFRNESAAALANLLALDSVARDLKTGAAEMLADPQVHSAAMTLMKQLISKQPDSVEVGRQLEILLRAPSVVKTVRGIIHTASSDPAVGKIGNAWLDKLGQDKALQDEFEKFAYGW